MTTQVINTIMEWAEDIPKLGSTLENVLVRSASILCGDDSHGNVAPVAPDTGGVLWGRGWSTAQPCSSFEFEEMLVRLCSTSAYWKSCVLLRRRDEWKTIGGTVKRPWTRPVSIIYKININYFCTNLKVGPEKKHIAISNLEFSLHHSFLSLSNDESTTYHPPGHSKQHASRRRK